MLLNKVSNGIFALNKLHLIIEKIENTNYKFSTLEAFNLPKNQIK